VKGRKEEVKMENRIGNKRNTTKSCKTYKHNLLYFPGKKTKHFNGTDMKSCPHNFSLVHAFPASKIM